MFDRNKLKAQMVLMGMTAEDVAKALDINTVTFYKKMKEDGRFTRAEINIMKQVLHIENVDEIFFAPELT